MATTQLKIYNGALMICGERAISALTDNVESRRLLDEVWNDGGVRYCLEQGQWLFAMRSSKLSYDTGVTPSFGYRRAFAKPTDFCVMAAVCSDEYFRDPLLQYTFEAGYWFSDLDEIYVRYVSDAITYGGDLSLWPASFTDFVKAYFASRIILKLTNAKTKSDDILNPRTGILQRALLTAKNRDAQGDPPKRIPPGLWPKARTSGFRGGPMGDGGSPGSLTG